MIFEKKSLRIVATRSSRRSAIHWTGVQRWYWWWSRLYLQDNCVRTWLGEFNCRWNNFVGAQKLRISDSDKEVERWQNRLHEVTTLNCNMMIRSLCCMTTMARELPTYDGLTAMDEFLRKFESTVPEHQWFDALKWALHVMPTRWWGMLEIILIWKGDQY